MDEKILISKSKMDAIGDAIRFMHAEETKYLADEMPNKIKGIQPVLEPKTVDENGDYYPPAGVDGFSEFHVRVQGGIGSVSAFLKITYSAGATCTCSNGTTTLTAPDTSGYWIAELPTDGVWTVTITNGTKSRAVQVDIEYADSINKSVYFHVGSDYTEVEYIEVQSQDGPYIDTGVIQKNNVFFEIDLLPLSSPSGFLYGSVLSPYTEIEVSGSKYTVYINSSSTNIDHGLNRHTIKAYESELSVDGNVIKSNLAWVNTNGKIFLFARSSSSGVQSKARGIRIYSLKIWEGDSLIREFYPCYRNSDNEPGMYDSVNRVFYPNIGTGSFVLGPEV